MSMVDLGLGIMELLHGLRTAALQNEIDYGAYSKIAGCALFLNRQAGYSQFTLMHAHYVHTFIRKKKDRYPGVAHTPASFGPAPQAPPIPLNALTQHSAHWHCTSRLRISDPSARSRLIG
jgi:hypothetical protein